MTRSGTATSAHAAEPASSWQQRCADELEKIRTEGDLALIKAHAEQQSLLAADAELQALKKQLKDAKQRFRTLGRSAAGAGSHGSVQGTLTASVLPTATSGGGERALGTTGSGSSRARGRGASAAFSQTTATAASASDTRGSEREGGCAPASSQPSVVALVGLVESVSPGGSGSSQRVAQTEERLRTALSERHVELQKLRQQIDRVRRQRLEGLQSEKRIVDATRQTDDDAQHAQCELAALKDRAAMLKRELAQLQSSLDVDQQAFRFERQRLTLEVERITRPTTLKDDGVKAALPGRVRWLWVADMKVCLRRPSCWLGT